MVPVGGISHVATCFHVAGRYPHDAGALRLVQKKQDNPRRMGFGHPGIDMNGSLGISTRRSGGNIPAKSSQEQRGEEGAQEGQVDSPEIEHSASSLKSIVTQNTGEDIVESISSNKAVSATGIDYSSAKNTMPEYQKQEYYDAFKDPYTQAGKRLDRLLSGIGDGEDELLDSMLMEQSVEKKIGLAVLAGSLVCGAAVLSCLFLDLDPLGGARMSFSSLKAAGTGAIVSIPLCLFKNALWSDAAHKELPFLQELQKTQVDDFKPILSGLSITQSGIIMACEVVPTIFILYPAFVGGILNMLEMYRQASDGIQNSVPDTIPPLVALTIVSLLSGISKLIDQGPSPEEYDVIKDALENADRYYKVMAGPEENNEDSKEAFKNVALLWLARRQVAARFAGAVSSFEIFYLGLLWLETGDLMAPMIAALALNAVDFIQITKRIPKSL